MVQEAIDLKNSAGLYFSVAEDALFKKLPKLNFAVAPGELLKIPFVKGGDPLAAHAGSGFQAFVTVMTGCDNCCSYCIVPKVRGHEYSRPADDIVREVECLAARGVKEVTFLGQSVLRYKGFPQLLRRAQEIDGIERIRFTSAHPGGCTDELIAAYRDCPKVCRHLHLPVQSGSDRVLREMGRRYTRAEYLAAVAKLHAFDPEFSVTTDVIVGYPGETEEDFAQMLAFLEEIRYDSAYTFLYSKRSGTPAAEMADQVPEALKHERLERLMAVQDAISREKNEALKGRTLEVLVEGPSKHDAAVWSGRTRTNKLVLFPHGAEQPGDLVEVNITHPQTWVLKGKTVASR